MLDEVTEDDEWPSCPKCSKALFFESDTYTYAELERNKKQEKCGHSLNFHHRHCSICGKYLYSGQSMSATLMRCMECGKLYHYEPDKEQRQDGKEEWTTSEMKCSPLDGHCIHCGDCGPLFSRNCECKVCHTHKPRRHVKALTYAPKIEAVRSGQCKQTIRPVGRKEIRVGDVLILHGWEGRPYRSPWSWRMEVTVTRVDCVFITKEGWVWTDTCSYVEWRELDAVAQKDGIDPPTGIAMGELFNSMYDLTEGRVCNIIGWD